MIMHVMWEQLNTNIDYLLHEVTVIMNINKTFSNKSTIKTGFNPIKIFTPQDKFTHAS